MKNKLFKHYLVQQLVHTENVNFLRKKINY